MTTQTDPDRGSELDRLTVPLHRALGLEECDCTECDCDTALQCVAENCPCCEHDDDA